jgi:hypothetical protein
VAAKTLLKAVTHAHTLTTHSLDSALWSVVLAWQSKWPASQGHPCHQLPTPPGQTTSPLKTRGYNYHFCGQQQAGPGVTMGKATGLPLGQVWSIGANSHPGLQ